MCIYAHTKTKHCERVKERETVDNGGQHLTADGQIKLLI